MDDCTEEQETALTLAFDEPKPFGRPTVYKPEYAVQAGKLCMLGATDPQIADFFGVSTRTVERWRVTHEDFCRAITVAKEEADNAVERSLYQKAMGYEQEAVKIFMPAGAVEPVYAKYMERIAPDTGAAIFWLKNRRRDKWRDRSEQDVNHTVTISTAFEELVREIAGKRSDRMIDIEATVLEAAE